MNTGKRISWDGIWSVLVLIVDAAKFLCSSLRRKVFFSSVLEREGVRLEWQYYKVQAADQDFISSTAYGCPALPGMITE